VDPDVPVSGQLADLFAEGAGNRVLPDALPLGRIVRSGDDGTGRPALWMSDEPASERLWAQAYADRSRSGLWPLLLEPLQHDEGFSPWESGELSFEQSTPADIHDPTSLLAKWWADYTSYDPGSDPLMNAVERHAVTAPYGTRWPGLAPDRKLATDPDSMALQYAAHLLSQERPLRLGLVASGRGADALAATGWTGPLNYTGDTGQIAAIVRSWENRFGVRVVGVGFADLYVSVAAPPVTLDEALPVAAEHFAFCPDNIWQGSPHTLTGYASRLVGINSWEFWWD
jgi:hypothetical protein